MEISGKVAVVAGGSTGIGKAISERLAAEGAKVLIAGVDHIKAKKTQYKDGNLGGYTAAKKLAEELNARGLTAAAAEADVTRWDQVQDLMEKAVREFGGLDIIVNSAGIITFALINDLTEDDWDNLMEVNAKGTFLVNKAAVSMLRRLGRGGRIVNVASVAGKSGNAGTAHYGASKAAVLAFSEGLAKEVAKEKITVNTVLPGIVGTQMWTMLGDARKVEGETGEEAYQRFVANWLPQGDAQTPEDIADAVVFLVRSDHITGSAVTVDGGMTAWI